MRDHTYIPFFIISAEVSSLDVENNNTRTRDLEEDLRKSGHKMAPITGSFKGRVEQSYIVYTSDKGLAFVLGKRYTQANVFIRSRYNDCTLLSTDGPNIEKFIGHLKQVDQEEALKHDAFSIISDRYYIVSSQK